MKSIVKVWEEDLLIPTYNTGKPEKNPMFLRNGFIREVVVSSIPIRLLRR